MALEKAILLNKTDSKIIDRFKDTKKFLELNDDELLNVLTNIGGKSAELVANIKAGKVYNALFDEELDQEHFQMSPEFVQGLKKTEKSNELSDKISKQFNEQHNKTEYEYICDIITSKAPSEIQIDKQDVETGEYIELRKKSSIVGAIQSRSRIKIYSDPKIKDPVQQEIINTTLKQIIEGIKI